MPSVEADYMREWRKRRGRAALAQQRAYAHALAALRNLHPEDFERLYAIERALEGLTPIPRLARLRAPRR